MSPQKRNKGNQGLPTGWRLKNGWYMVRTTRRNRHLFDGKGEFPLGKTLSEAYKVYGERIQSDGFVDTMPKLLERYSVEVTPTKAQSTQDKELKRIHKLSEMLQDFRVDQLEAHHCYQLRSSLAEKHGPTTANRHTETLSHALTKACEWGIIKTHPMIEAGFRKLPVDVHRRIPEHWEIDEALEVAPPLIRAYVGLKRLTGLRMGDMLTLRWSDIDDGVLHVKPRKTARSSGKAQDWTITPDLQAAMDACREAQKPATRKDGKPGRPRVSGMHLFCTREGQPYSPDGFASIWQRWMRKALRETKLEQRFNERSIRTYVGSWSESDQDAADRLGHSSTSTTRKHYRERATVVRPLKVEK